MFKRKSRSRGRSFVKRKRSRSPKSYRAASAGGFIYRTPNTVSTKGRIAAIGSEYLTGNASVGRAVENYFTRQGRYKSSSTGRSGGRFGMGKRYKKRNRKLSFKTVQNKGISAVQEITFNPGENSVDNKADSVAIAHTSMPIKVSLQNLMRALVKYISLALNLSIRDFGDRVSNYAIAVGDKFEMAFYSTWDATTLSATSHSVTLDQTWDEVAYYLATQVNDYTNVGNARFMFAAYEPAAASKHPPITLDLFNAKVHVYTTSILNIQNRTVSVAADNEADDVNNVPLQGRMMVVKGNNLLRRAGNPLLLGILNSNRTEESLLYKDWTRQLGTINAGQPIAYNAYAQRYFLKPTDPGTTNDYKNIVSSSWVNIEPGQIKTSVLSKSFVMSFSSYMSLLGNRGSNDNQLTYDPKCGFTKAFLLEKKIGSTVSDILVQAECEFRQTIAIINTNKSYTAPISWATEQTGILPT